MVRRWPEKHALGRRVVDRPVARCALSHSGRLTTVLGRSPMRGPRSAPGQSPPTDVALRGRPDADAERRVQASASSGFSRWPAASVLHRASGLGLVWARISNMGVTTAQARRIALALPEAVEQDHHGRPSFRVDGRIFATLWDEHRMNVMLDEGGIRTAVESAPDICAPISWGKRVVAVAVTLSAVDAPFLGELLADAWEGKAPRRLLVGR